MLALIVALPFILVWLPSLGIKISRQHCALLSFIIPASLFAWLVWQAPSILNQEFHWYYQEWIPALGLNLSFRLDGLSWLFACLITGIGSLVVLYASKYLSQEDPMARFYAYLLLFMGAMLGLVLSNNLLLMVFFWELTSLSSFLLIGYWSKQSDARRGARMALTVTGGGGLALLAGVVILGQIAGSYELDQVMQQAKLIKGHSLYPLLLALILIGAFSKSAQFPFHFWLPHAMSAPTPVSAYLHSATMVKAGVFLLARLYPALAGTDLWFFWVSTTGLATLLLGALVAFYKTDLKGLLAYSTISHLGLITLLFGLNSPLAPVVAIFHLLNHAIFKAALFMTAGIVDHETGTRDLSRLRGLRLAMPITALLGLMASAAMAGLPLFNGFLSKEMLLAESLEQSVWGHVSWLIPILVTLAAGLSIAYSLRFAWMFFGPVNSELEHKPHDPPLAMWAPVAFLVAMAVITGIAPGHTAEPLVQSASFAILNGNPPGFYLSLWHGFNLPLLMSVLAIGLGTGYFMLRQSLWALWQRLPPLNAKKVFELLIHDLLIIGARKLHQQVENHSLQRYLSLMLLATFGISLYYLWQIEGLTISNLQAITPPLAAVSALMIACALAVVVTHHQRFTALLFLGAVGLGMAMFFNYFSAPDLALTQISVELVSVILMMLVLFLLPATSPKESNHWRISHNAFISILAGLTIGTLCFLVMLTPGGSSLTDFTLAQAKPGGGGTNVVNVILVDFRGFDTFGEITVMAIAAVGIYGMLDGMKLYNPNKHNKAGWSVDSHPMVLSVITMPLLPMALMVSAYIFLRGHNMPGGGFIAGLVTAIALILQYLANGLNWSNQRMNWEHHYLLAVGLMLAIATGLAPLAFGLPFLTSWFDYFHLPLIGEIELASAMLFDTGVYITVVSATLLILANLGKLKPLEATRGAN